MTFDRTEQLVRDVFTEEAGRAVASREVLAAVRGSRPRRSYGLVLATAAVVVVVAAVAAFVVPEVFRRGSVPPASGTGAGTSTNVLVVGLDRAELTDSVVLVQLAGDGSASVVSLPRDTWVLADGKMTRLNTVYRNSGIESLRTTVGDLTGVPVEHYAVVDMAAVGELVDAVGGVPVCLRFATSDPLAGADFPEGPQILDGAGALAFLRQRHDLPNSDFDRMVRLQEFLRSLLMRLDGKHLPTLLTAVQGHVRTDPSLDVLGFLQDIAREPRLRVGTIPVTDTDHQAPGGGSVVAVDPAEVRRYMTDMRGMPPATGDHMPCVY